MRNESRVLFNQLRRRIAELNGVESAAETFAVEPTVQQKLEKRIQESSDLLTRINVIGVDDIKGQKVGIGVGSTIAGRTNTTNNDRTPRDVSDTTGNTYECFQTNFDTALPYAKIDAWAKHPQFQTLVRDVI